MYTTLVIASVIIIGLTILAAHSKRELKKQQKTIESYVRNIFSAQTYRPEVNSGFSYGIPYFTLKFNTDKDKQHAISNGFTKQFLNNIQELCGHLRPRGGAFEAERAVAIFSTEDEKRWDQDTAGCHRKASK